AGSPPSPAPPAGSLLSTGSTASAPAGNMPPVGIQTASPGPTFTEGASPMRTCPRTVSTGAMPGSTGLVSAARTAQPSMVARAKAGTSASARTSRASTRPPASRSVTCSSGGRYGGRASRKRRKAPATVDRFFASKGFAASRTATASRGSGHRARTLDLALPIQAQRGRDGAQGIDDHLDVVVQVHPQLGGAPDKLVAVHAFRERFIFHLLLNGLDFHFVNALVGTHQSHRHHEAGHLIHRVQRLGHQVAPLEVEVIRVALDGVNDVLGVAQLLQDGGTLQRVVRRVRPALVVKIVQQTGDPPPLLVFAEAPGIGPHGRLPRQSMAQQAFALGVLGQELPRRGSGHDVVSRGQGLASSQRSIRKMRKPPPRPNRGGGCLARGGLYAAKAFSA